MGVRCGGRRVGVAVRVLGVLGELAGESVGVAEEPVSADHAITAATIPTPRPAAMRNRQAPQM